MRSNFHRLGLYIILWWFLLYFYLCSGSHIPGRLVVTELLHNWSTGDYRMFLLEMCECNYFKWKPYFLKFLNIAFFCDVVPYNLLDMYWHFRGSCCLHYYGRWRWREQDPPKCLYTFARPYSRKRTCEWDLRFSWWTKTLFYTVLLVIAVKTSNSTHTHICVQDFVQCI